MENGLEGFQGAVDGDHAGSFCALGTFVHFLGFAPKMDPTGSLAVSVVLEKPLIPFLRVWIRYLPLNGLCLRSVGADGGRPLILGGPGYGGGIGGTGPLFRGATGPS